MYVPEPGSEQAAALLSRLAAEDLDLLAPDLLYPETGNILRKKARIKKDFPPRPALR